jgi:Fe-S cluster biogenesis protein NfuA
MSDELKDQVQAALEEIRPFLQADGGDVELVEVTPEKVALVRLQGACGGCPMSQMTLKAGIEERVRERVPDIVSVEAVQ